MVSAAESMAARIKREAARGAVLVRPGLVVSTSWVADAPVTVISVDGVNFTNLPISGQISLIPGMTVNVLRLAGQMVVMGSGSADVLPLQGTVSATGTGTCQVRLAYTSGVRTVAASWLTHYTPAVSDVVMISWAYGKPVITGKLSQPLASSLEPPYVPPPPPPAPTSGTSTFTANDSGTVSEAGNWQLGKDVEARTSWGLTYGYWFYGTRVKDSMTGRINAGTKSMSIYVDVERAEYGFTLFLHAANKRSDVLPGGASIASISYPKSASGWVSLPSTWANSLITQGGGIGLAPAGDNAWMKGVDRSSQSGAVRIQWVSA